MNTIKRNIHLTARFRLLFPANKPFIVMRYNSLFAINANFKGELEGLEAYETLCPDELPF